MIVDNTMIKVEIKGLLIDPITRMPIIILKKISSDKEEKILPIWVGIFEANAIAVKIEGIESPRPMTHDLLQNIITQIGCDVKRIEINNLEDNTYFANIIIDKDGEELNIDSRPSDAIALSLRTESPIFVSEKVFKKAFEKIDMDKTENMKQDDLKKWFENLSPDIMNKFKM